MKRWAIGLLCLLTFVFPFKVSGLEFPRPIGFVNDFAEIFSNGFKSKLEKDLSDFEKETSTEIAVVTIRSLKADSIDNYAVRLFEQWKIGKKDKDNGLLLLIAKNERKIKIEVGYGLEPVVTDGRAGRIIRAEMRPAFKKGNYEQLVKIRKERENEDLKLP